MGSTNRPATTARQNTAAGQPGTTGTAALTRSHTDARTAVAEAYRRHLPALTAHVAARLRHRDPDVVADLVHDAFADALADPTTIGADVLHSLRRLCDRAYTRHLWAQRQYLAAAHTLYVDAQRADQHTDVPRPAQPTPLEALAALPEDQRQVAYLRFLGGHSPRITARLLRRSVRTVGYLERRARRQLREHLTAPAQAATTAPTARACRA